MQGGFVQPQMVIRAPADGVVAVDNGVEGAFVTAGTQLAVAYNGAAIFVTARVDETDINEVHTGQPVDISVDAFPDTDLTGRVLEVKGGAAGVFSLFPQANTSGNFQKVTQVIPVKISIDDLQGPRPGPGHERHGQDPPRLTPLRPAPPRPPDRVEGSVPGWRSRGPAGWRSAGGAVTGAWPCARGPVVDVPCRGGRAGRRRERARRRRAAGVSAAGRRGRPGPGRGAASGPAPRRPR